MYKDGFGIEFEALSGKRERARQKNVKETNCRRFANPISDN